MNIQTKTLNFKRHPMSYHIHKFNELDSTNTYALQHLSTLKDHDIILTDRQTRGYGRFKRHWVSENRHNLYVSIVLKPGIPVSKAAYLPNLIQYLALTICQVLGQYHVSATLKWPNDVLVSGKKIAGLLGESSVSGNRLNGFVLGAGINLNMCDEELAAIDQPATALNHWTDLPVDKQIFLRQLLDYFFPEYQSVLNHGFPAFREAYVKKSPYLGQTITIRTEKENRGIAQGFTDNGALQMVCNQTEMITFHAGDLVT